MVRNLFMALVGCLLMVGSASANTSTEIVTFDGAAALNDPSQTVVTVRKVVDVLNPSIDTLYLIKNNDLSDGEVVYGVSASLYNIRSKDFPLGSVRVGYAMERGQRIYGGVRADLEGLAFRYLPDFGGGWVLDSLDGVLTFAANYTKIGFVGGWDFSGGKLVWGPSIGAEVKF